MSGGDGAAFFDVDRGTVVCRLAIGACKPLQRVRLPRAETMIGSVAAARAPVVVDVTEVTDTRDGQQCLDLGLTTLLMLPLRRGRSFNGVLLAAFRDEGDRSPAADGLLQSVAQVGAARLEHLALASEREADERLLAAIAEAGRAVLTADEPAQALCDWARSLTGASYSSFLEPNATGELVLNAQSGAHLPALTVGLDKPSRAVTAFTSGRAQVVHDYHRDPEALARVVTLIAPAGLPEPRSAAYLPVRTGQSTLGVICLLLGEPFILGTMTVLGLVGMLAAEAALAIDRDRLRRELEQQASTDALTGVANRRTYGAHLSRELARAARTGNALTLVLVDLDHFKSYNDQRGHLAGDTLLRTVSRRWRDSLREPDLLARLGGDEFAVVLPDTDAPQALVLCTRMLDTLPANITASAGIAQWNGAEDMSTLYHRCDEALYAAKDSGRDCARIAP
jgi:diguanylate cyclase (GGDEF)-like protein